MILNNLITDRAQKDVLQWKDLRDKGLSRMSAEERALWQAGMKGSYNATDLNRVTDAMVYLANVYRQYGYSVAFDPIIITHLDGTADTTWRLTDIPTAAQMQQFLDNVRAFWEAVEEASASVASRWGDLGYGYVYLDAIIKAGDYATITGALGIAKLRVVISSAFDLDRIAASGAGWTVTTELDGITAAYAYPNGDYQDLQAALDNLTILCSASDGYVDATVDVYADLRSGASVLLGTGAVTWSNIINWAAFDVYGYTWADIETAEMTWANLERLPIPEGGCQ